jgi:hypothetical protein
LAVGDLMVNGRCYYRWRFSLQRLIIASMFLGAVIGLNVREVGPWWQPYDFYTSRYAILSHCWGWPFPFHAKMDSTAGYGHMQTWWNLDRDTDAPVTDAGQSVDLPCTHFTYRLLKLDVRLDGPAGGGFVVWGGVIDAIFALTVVALILFLHLRRQPPELENAL